MKRLIVTLFVALAALCISVSGFGDDIGYGWSLVQCRIDSEGSERAHGRKYLFADDYEDGYCFKVEAICKGDNVEGNMVVEFFTFFPDGLSLLYSGNEIESYDNACTFTDDEAPLYLFVGAKEWSVKCGLDGKRSFEAKISSVKMKYCED